MTTPKKPCEKELFMEFDLYTNEGMQGLRNAGYNQGIKEMDDYYKPILDEIAGDLTSCVELIRGTYPMVNSLALLERCEQALAKYKAIR